MYLRIGKAFLDCIWKIIISSNYFASSWIDLMSLGVDHRDLGCEAGIHPQWCTCPLWTISHSHLGNFSIVCAHACLWEVRWTREHGHREDMLRKSRKPGLGLNQRPWSCEVATWWSTMLPKINTLWTFHRHIHMRLLEHLSSDYVIINNLYN